MRTGMARWFVCLLLAALAICVSSATGPPTGPSTRQTTRPTTRLGKLPQPGPEYKPDQVVQIVMDSLQHNDQDDSGIATTFNFASPGNKKYTGPLEKFTAMVKTTAYKPMLNCKSIEYGAMQIEGDRAQQVVTLVDSADQTAHYLFRLSRQTDGPFKNCWMTDGVIRVEPRPIGDRPARRTV